MDQDYYREYATIEDVHWWFRGRRAIFSRVLDQLAVDPHRRILDIGFGTGAMLRLLARYGKVVGMDTSVEAIRFARTRCPQPMLLGSITDVPLRSASVDLVTAFDVLEHVGQEGQALGEMARICRPGGHALLTVPAFQFLWGNQDVISQHRRRYTLAQLRTGIQAAGFRVMTLTYFNALLFPIVAAVRVARRLRNATPAEQVKSDFTITKPGLVNDVLAKVFASERTLVTRWRLPVGVSVLCLAQRDA